MRSVDLVVLFFLCVNSGVQVVPGTPGPVESAEAAKEFCETYGLPVIFKAAFGGGGRGMRVVRNPEVILHTQIVMLDLMQIVAPHPTIVGLVGLPQGIRLRKLGPKAYPWITIQGQMFTGCKTGYPGCQHIQFDLSLEKN